MATNPIKNDQLIPKNVIENITIRKIMSQYPETITYKSLIRFRHTGNKATLDLDLLPPELATKILAIFHEV